MSKKWKRSKPNYITANVSCRTLFIFDVNLHNGYSIGLRCICCIWCCFVICWVKFVDKHKVIHYSKHIKFIKEYLSSEPSILSNKFSKYQKIWRLILEPGKISQKSSAREMFIPIHKTMTQTVRILEERAKTDHIIIEFPQ